MGFFPGEYINNAVRYLLRVLLDKEEVRYSLFYDQTVATHERIKSECGLQSDESGLYSPELAIDLAVYELSQKGFVDRIELAELLPDWEPDYLIRLLPAGRAFAMSGTRHRSQGQDL